MKETVNFPNEKRSLSMHILAKRRQRDVIATSMRRHCDVNATPLLTCDKTSFTIPILQNVCQIRGQNYSEYYLQYEQWCFYRIYDTDAYKHSCSSKMRKISTILMEKAARKVHVNQRACRIALSLLQNPLNFKFFCFSSWIINRYNYIFLLHSVEFKLCTWYLNI